MAGIAGGWETGGAMIWICSAVVLCFVTAVALFRGVCVVAVQMTGGARLLLMNPYERENFIVIKIGASPVRIRGLVTRIACGGETSGAMIWFGRVVILRFVTAVALFRRVCIVAVLVAGGAELLLVNADKWVELVVIKIGASPIRIGCLVTGIACGGETGVAVIGVGCVVVLGFVASVTFLGCISIIGILMTGCAGLLRMNADKRVELAVIKIGAIPIRIRGLVTRIAGSRKTGVSMVGVGCAVVLGFVAPKAILGCSCITSVDVAGGAGLLRMNADKWENCIVIEWCRVPGVVSRVVACAAGRWEVGGHMIGLFGVLIILTVA